MMSNRAAKEKRYWDQVYQDKGPYHEIYSWLRTIDENSYGNHFFNCLLKKFRGQRIPTIDGGIDTIGVMLAKDNRVVSVDISERAALKTRELARKSGVEENFNSVVMNCEEMIFNSKFDVIICQRAFHHMNLSRVIQVIHASLAENGLFIGEEPVCLLNILRWVHEKFPFHPDSPHTEDEIEFTEKDLAFIEGKFRKIEFYYIDFLSRGSLAYFLLKVRSENLLGLLGKIDFYLINRFLPRLKYLSSYVIIQAFK